MGKGKKWILEKHFQGMPKRSDMKIVEFDLPTVPDGSFLVEAIYLSVDPYMRPYSARLPEGITMIGTQVAKVIETKNADFPVGTLVVCPGGWTTHSLCKGENESKLPPYPEGVPLSLALGTLGMPGMTAHYGLLEICAPKPGEVVVVSGAAGAVGSVVGQIAKIKGCKVIGFAGSDEKVAWLKELGFDEAFNYKTIKNLDATLKSVAPDGINCYFDNVGGEFASTVVTNMAKYGRISCCGAISQYNDTAPQKLRAKKLLAHPFSPPTSMFVANEPFARQLCPKSVPPVFGTLVFMEIKMEGFIITTHIKHWPEWTKQHIQWIKEGKLKYKEHVTQGFDNMFDAFLGLFSGANTGKAIVKV